MQELKEAKEILGRIHAAISRIRDQDHILKAVGKVVTLIEETENKLDPKIVETPPVPTPEPEPVAPADRDTPAPAPEPEPVVEATPEPVVETTPPGLLYNFEALKKLLLSDDWPNAVNPDEICDMELESDMQERAEGIMDLMVEVSLRGRRFLDFGCGDGRRLGLSDAQGTEISVGYDVKKHPLWAAPTSGKILTTNFSDVEANAPYHNILLFDVLDHIVGNETPVELLKRLHSLLAPRGILYMRVHPWTSRHATHVYKELNKAYAHLVFSPEELLKLVPESSCREESNHIVYPIMTYRKYCKEAGFKEMRMREIKEPPEKFFSETAMVRDRILTTVRAAGFKDDDGFPTWQMSQQFLDFVLEK
jgi:2-polyprenyl-3-methyl-5-hydroxy-6-metoxy-1,4-benzoquinol methylase